MGRLLTFSRDGVLRLRLTARGQGRETVIRDVPLAALELAHDPHVLLSALSDPVVFEPGLTVLDLLENLAPWEGQIGALARMNFPAFLAEARLAAPLSGMIDRVEIYRSPIDDAWDFRARLTAAGAAQEGEACVSLIYEPLDQWSLCPISVVLDDDDDESPTLHDAVIGGLLCEIGFDGTPAGRDARAHVLETRIRGLSGEAAPIPDPDVVSDHPYRMTLREIEAAERAADRLGLRVIDPEA